MEASRQMDPKILFREINWDQESARMEVSEPDWEQGILGNGIFFFFQK